MREPVDFLHASDDSSRATFAADLSSHLVWLVRAARGLGFSPSDAEDLAQSAVSTFLDVMPRFEGRSSLRTFLFGIMRRKAAELRRHVKRIELTEALSDVRGALADGEAQLESAELGRTINECIGELPPKQRDAARLRFMDERETEDAGRELGVSANYFGVLINRARAHLRDCIGAHGFGH